jgi:hypothetical protein
MRWNRCVGRSGSIMVSDPTWRVIEGDARELDVEDGSVHVVALSVPYWGLRNYGTEPVVWGGDAECVHEWGTPIVKHRSAGGPVVPQTIQGVDTGVVGAQRDTSSNLCHLCGAWRGSLGLEPRVDQWVDNLVSCGREWKRVLRDDGTLWVNCGDAYSSIGHKKANSGYGTTGLAGGHAQVHHPLRRENDASDMGLKHKDLQADGWFLRSAIVWGKGVDWLPNERLAQAEIQETLQKVREEAAASLFGLSKELSQALKRAEKAVDRIMTSGPCMPESVTDRTTSSYEMLFMFSKQPRYYFDQTAIRVGNNVRIRKAGGYEEDRGIGNGTGGQDGRRALGLKENDTVTVGRNPRSVQGTFILPDGEECSHFAAWPSLLVERILKAAAPMEGVCGTCGAPWERVEKRTPHTLSVEDRHGRQSHTGSPPQQSGWYWTPPEVEQAGWVPQCTCHGSPVEGRKCSKCGAPYIRKPIITDSRKDLHGPTYSRHRTSIPGGQSLVTGPKETIRWEPTCECHGSPIEGPVPCEHCRGTGHQRVGVDYEGKWEDGDEQSASRRLLAHTRAAREAGADHEVGAGDPLAMYVGDPCPHCLCPSCNGTGQETTHVVGTQSYTSGTDIKDTPQRDNSGGLSNTPKQTTGNPCPTCSGLGSLGYIQGPVWEDDVLESWPRVPATVLDPIPSSTISTHST